MPLPLYLLRRPAASIPSALYTSTYGDRSISLAMPQSNDPALQEEAVFLTVGHQGPFQEKEQFSYKELLKLVLQAERVVTL